MKWAESIVKICFSDLLFDKFYAARCQREMDIMIDNFRKFKEFEKAKTLPVQEKVPVSTQTDMSINGPIPVQQHPADATNSNESDDIEESSDDSSVIILD